MNRHQDEKLHRQKFNYFDVITFLLTENNMSVEQIVSRTYFNTHDVERALELMEGYGQLKRLDTGWEQLIEG